MQGNLIGETDSCSQGHLLASAVEGEGTASLYSLKHQLQHPHSPETAFASNCPKPVHCFIRKPICY